MRILILVVALSLFSCDASQSTGAKEHPENPSPAAIFGWFDGLCFSTAEKNLSKGTEILVVALDEPQSLSTAVVSGPANSSNCAPLLADRQEQNLTEGVSFYTVKSDLAITLAIGVIGVVSQPAIKDGWVQADIGNDGRVERFTFCTTSEGLSFDIWASLPYASEPIWSGYYYLGYDVESTCP